MCRSFFSALVGSVLLAVNNEIVINKTYDSIVYLLQKVFPEPLFVDFRVFLRWFC